MPFIMSTFQPTGVNQSFRRQPTRPPETPQQLSTYGTYRNNALPLQNIDKSCFQDRINGTDDSFLEFRTHAPPETPRIPIIPNAITPASNQTSRTTTQTSSSRPLDLTEPSMTNVTTPKTHQALLSRTPQALLRLLTTTNVGGAVDGRVDAGGMTMAQCDAVRHQAAQDMLMQTKSGKRNMFIFDHNTIGDGESRNENIDHSDLTGTRHFPIDTNTAMPGASRRPLIMGGTLSIRHSLQFQSNLLNEYDDNWQNNSMQRPLVPSLKTTTGCRELDDLLHLVPPLHQCPNDGSHDKLASDIGTDGVLDEPISLMGHVLQLSGPSASFKTLLALQIAVEFAMLPGTRETTSNNDELPAPQNHKRPSYQVMYLTSRAGHTTVGMAKRLKQIARQRGLMPEFGGDYTTINRSRIDEESDKHPIFSAITFYETSNCYQLLQQLARIEDRLWQEFQHQAANSSATVSSTRNLRLGMIVIDSIYQIAMVNDQQQQKTDMNVLLQVGHVLKRLARQYSVSVVVTNGVVRANQTLTNSKGTSNGETVSYKPALGEAWHHIAVDLHLGLEPVTSHSPTLSSLPSNTNNSQMMICVRLKQHVTKLVCDDNEGSHGQRKDYINQVDKQNRCLVHLMSTPYGLQDASIASNNDDDNAHVMGRAHHGSVDHTHFDNVRGIQAEFPPAKRSRSSFQETG